MIVEIKCIGRCKDCKHIDYKRKTTKEGRPNKKKTWFCREKNCLVNPRDPSCYKFDI